MPSPWRLSGNDLQNDMEQIHIIGVVGAGTMGNGIAHVAARSGYRVILSDIEQKALERALATISRNLDREVAKEANVQQTSKSEAMARISATVQMEDSQRPTSLLKLSLRISTLN